MNMRRWQLYDPAGYIEMKLPMLTAKHQWTDAEIGDVEGLLDAMVTIVVSYRDVGDWPEDHFEAHLSSDAAPREEPSYKE